MTPSILHYFSRELEKLALTEQGAEKIQQNSQKSRRMGYTDIKHSDGFTTRHRPQPVSFGEGVKRNLVATGRRMMNPKDMVRRVKHSVTGPGVPTSHKLLAGAGIAASVANAAPKKDPSGEGKSRIHRALEGAGGILGGTAGKGWSGGLVGGTVGAGIGSLAGKAIDKVRGYKKPTED